MKQLYFLLFFISFQLSFAQTPIDTLLNNNWRLIQYDDGSELGMYDFLSNPELDQISLNFFTENETLYYQTHVCRTKTGAVGEITEDGPVYNLTFGDFEIEGNECVETDSQIFENAFFGHIYDEFEYWFYFVEQENGAIHLNISSSHFCTATFTNALLSNEEVIAESIFLYPNPVEDKLLIENPDLNITEISVTDTNGKLLMHKNINEKTIRLDFKSFSKGIYIVNFKSSGKAIKSKKIIKK